MSSNTKQSITIRDIAVKAKVSKSTVSRVLNNSTSVNEQKRAAVLTAMQQLEYKPNALARGLAGGQSMTIGVVTQNIGSPFYDYTTHGIISGLHGTNYFPLVVDGQWNAEIEQVAIRTPETASRWFDIGRRYTFWQDACGACRKEAVHCSCSKAGRLGGALLLPLTMLMLRFERRTS